MEETSEQPVFPYYFAYYTLTRSTDPIPVENNINSEGKSLLLLASDLDPNHESELTSFLDKKIQSGTRYSQEGVLTNLDFSLDAPKKSCIGYVIQFSTEDKNEYIVCLLTSSDVTLEFFRTELQAYVDKLASSFNHKPTSCLPEVKEYLKKWTHSCVYYVCRCLKMLKSDVSVLLFVTSVNGQLEVIGGTEEQKTDIEQFMQSCSLADVLMASVDSVNDIKKNDVNVPPCGVTITDISNDTLGNVNRHLTINKDGTYAFDNCGVDVYCQDWAEQLLEGDPENPVYLKRVLENFKLMTVHSMNCFKRLLILARSDYYALYRVLRYLEQSHQRTTLLRHARLQPDLISVPDIRNIITTLEEFIDKYEHGSVLLKPVLA